MQEVIDNHNFSSGKKPTAEELYLNIGYVVDYLNLYIFNYDSIFNDVNVENCDNDK